MSWILDEEKLLDVNRCYTKESFSKITAHYVYLNVNDYIDNISCEELHFNWDNDKNVGTISNNSLLKLIEEKKIFGTKKYTFEEGITFLISLESDDIFGFSELVDLKSVEKQFLKPFTLLEDLILEPSIFVFHSINAIYFFFRESDKIHKPKSILKIIDSVEKKRDRVKTKKVRVILPSKKKNKTRKYLEK